MHDVAVAVFVLSAAAIAYTIAGYPLLLLVLTSLKRRQQIQRQWAPRTVTVLLAVYNGERWISRKIESLLGLDYPPELMHILVLDDGSTDRTADMVTRVGDPRVELVTQPHGGKATALNAGLLRAEGEILFFTDVRQALDPVSLRRLVERFADPRVGVVSGELVIRKGDREEEAVGLYWRYEKWIRQRLSEIDSVAGATGCIYAMRRELAVPLPPSTLVDDMYLPLSAFLRGSRVVFEPGAKAFDEPTTPAVEFRRKVRTLAGNFQILVDLPRLLSPSNRMWFHFLSHKVLRLFLPYAVILVGVSSFALPPPYRAPVLAVQACFYVTALADMLVPASWPLKRVSGIARTFVVLMSATLCAPMAVLLARRTVWSTSR
jgi:cellulose synthase/poly-beta-1,6-N-acetylglucosamine synthase-like glycosyltransferase